MRELLHFEDFAVGQKFALGQHRLTAEEIVTFAHEYDPQPQHTDVAAAGDVLGGFAASGWHLCALAMRMLVNGLLARSASLGAPGVEEVQWRRPVRPGDLLRLDAEVLEVRASESRPDRGFVRLRAEMARGEGASRERVMLMTWPAMIARRGVDNVA